MQSLAKEGSPLLMLWGAGKDKKVKEAWPSITTDTAEVANKGVSRTVFTKVSPVHTSHSSEAANGCPGGWHSPVLAVRKKSLLAGRKEQFSCKEWAAERNFAALGEPQLLPSCSLLSAQSCLPPPYFLVYFSHLELQPFPWGPPQPWKWRAVWLGEGSFTIRLITKEGVQSLTREKSQQAAVCAPGWGSHRTPARIAQPCSLLPPPLLPPVCPAPSHPSTDMLHRQLPVTTQ